MSDFNKTILFVDDEPSARKLMDRIFRDKFSILTAGSTKEAMDIVINLQWLDVVLTDIKMPEEDGMVLFEKVKKRYPQVPVILLTGHGDKELAVEAVRKGAFDFIDKPFNEDELMITVDKAVEYRRFLDKHNKALRNLKVTNVELESIRNDLELLKDEVKDSVNVAGGIAHDVKNPATVISFHGNMIESLINEENVDKEAIKNSAQKIVRYSDRIAKISQSLLSLLRKESNIPFIKENVFELIEDAASICLDKYRDSEVELNIDQIPRDLEIECKGVAISQVILNLLNNACDALKNFKDKWVVVKAEQVENFASIRVIDSGNGIDDVTKHKIFDAFYTTKPEGKGTGLGLNICQKIVEDHGGKIDIETECPNTCFVINLPIKKTIKI